VPLTGRRVPGHPRPHREHHEPIAIRELPLPLGFVEPDGHRARYGVARPFEGDDELLSGDSQAVCHFVDDAGRRLVRHHPVDIVQGEAGALHLIARVSVFAIRRDSTDRVVIRGASVGREETSPTSARTYNSLCRGIRLKAA